MKYIAMNMAVMDRDDYDKYYIEIDMINVTMEMIMLDVTLEMIHVYILCGFRHGLNVYILYIMLTFDFLLIAGCDAS